MASLEKYLKKSGRSQLEISKVLKSAGERRMKDKIKMQDKSGDELPVDGKEVAKAVKSDFKTGSVTKVKDDGAKPGSNPGGSEFKPVGKKKPYLD